MTQKLMEDEQLMRTGERRVLLGSDDIHKLRTAQRVVAAAIHPDTGDFIPWACRISSFLPMNMPIVFGFILARPTPFNTVFWQWINQTYNATLNYGNRNASSLYTHEDIAKSYLVAATSSIVVALGIRKVLSGYTKHLTGSKLTMANTFSSFWACSFAGYMNGFFMRRTELEKGIDVKDKEGSIVGKSKKAAKKAV